MSNSRRLTKKLHCQKCGKLRNMELYVDLPFRNEEGGIDLTTATCKVGKAKKLYREHRNEILPTDYYGQCPVCKFVTFYKVNTARKMVAVGI